MTAGGPFALDGVLLAACLGRASWGAGPPAFPLDTWNLGTVPIRSQKEER